MEHSTIDFVLESGQDSNSETLLDLRIEQQTTTFYQLLHGVLAVNSQMLSENCTLIITCNSHVLHVYSVVDFFIHKKPNGFNMILPIPIQFKDTTPTIKPNSIHIYHNVFQLVLHVFLHQQDVSFQTLHPFLLLSQMYLITNANIYHPFFYILHLGELLMEIHTQIIVILLAQWVIHETFVA